MSQSERDAFLNRALYPSPLILGRFRRSPDSPAFFLPGHFVKPPTRSIPMIA
jgi:hypothetical protein